MLQLNAGVHCHLICFMCFQVVNRLRKDHVYDTLLNYGVNYDNTWIYDKIHHEINQFCSAHSLQQVYIDMFDQVRNFLASMNRWSASLCSQHMNCLFLFLLVFVLFNVSSYIVIPHLVTLSNSLVPLTASGFNLLSHAFSLRDALFPFLKSIICLVRWKIVWLLTFSGILKQSLAELI